MALDEIAIGAARCDGETRVGRPPNGPLGETLKTTLMPVTVVSGVDRVARLGDRNSTAPICQRHLPRFVRHFSLFAYLQ